MVGTGCSVGRDWNAGVSGVRFAPAAGLIGDVELLQRLTVPSFTVAPQSPSPLAPLAPPTFALPQDLWRVRQLCELRSHPPVAVALATLVPFDIQFCLPTALVPF